MISIPIERELLLFDHALAAAKIIDASETNIKSLQSSVEVKYRWAKNKERLAKEATMHSEESTDSSTSTTNE